MKKQRFIELDIWRGLAVIGMVVFHGVYILDYFEVVNQQMFEGGWHVLGQLVRFSFLLLVGISMVISYKNGIARAEPISQIRKRQMKRALIVFSAAVLITIFSYIFLQEAYVRFGILHLIAVSIFLLSFVVDRKYSALMFSLAVFAIGQFFVWPVFSGAVDSFPIFPWMSLPAFGIFIGHCLYEWFKQHPSNENLGKITFIQPLLFLGKNALKIYILHVPILILLFWLFGIISLDQFL